MGSAHARLGTLVTARRSLRLLPAVHAAAIDGSHDAPDAGDLAVRGAAELGKRRDDAVLGRGGPGDTTQYPAPTEGAWTIDELFQRLLDAKRHGAQVHVRFDGYTGAVLHARVDGEAEDADWAFEVREFRALDVAVAREPVPMFISR
jgi:hypothetical protein